MEAIGQFLMRIGPAFAVVMFFLAVTSGVTLVLLSLVRLAQRERPGLTRPWPAPATPTPTVTTEPMPTPT